MNRASARQRLAAVALAALVPLTVPLVAACGPPATWDDASGSSTVSASAGPGQGPAGSGASDRAGAGTTTHGGVLSGGAVSEAQWHAAISAARAATYEVHNRGCEYDATGTAVAVSPDELVTNRHVVAGARTLSVTAASGARLAVASWQVSTVDDLALLRVAPAGLRDTLTLADTAAVPGDLVAALGYPLGGALTVGRGRVVDLDDLDSGHLMIRSSMDILPGNSGGPLINTSGELVGLVRAIDLNAGWALAVPGDRITRAVNEDDLHAGVPCD